MSCDAVMVIRGLGFELCVLKKFYWERHPQKGPAVRDSNLVKTARAPETGWKTVKKKKKF